MSGIAGYYSNNKPTKKVLKAMTDRIAHRGPDGEGHYLDDNIALGHRLLQTTKKIKDATVTDLCQVKGINKELAEKIYNYYNGENDD